jgi:hypothetical protein
MVDKHGLIVECAYNQLEKNLDNYKSTVDQAKKSEYLFKAFNEFLTNLRK